MNFHTPQNVYLRHLVKVRLSFCPSICLSACVCLPVTEAQLLKNSLPHPFAANGSVIEERSGKPRIARNKREREREKKRQTDRDRDRDRNRDRDRERERERER